MGCLSLFAWQSSTILLFSSDSALRLASIRLYEGMNVSRILNQVDALHAKAASIHMVTLKIDGLPYELTFNGRNWVATTNGTTVAEFNTRSATTAKQWLRDYLAN